jgi:dTDP-glucose 4,6-dehydratase
VTALALMVEGLESRDYLKKFLQVGSSEIYGAVEGAVTEEAPLTPTSPYSISKMAGDLHLESMHAVRGFPMNIIRPSNAYGPGQQLYRILPRAVLAAVTGQKVPLEGGGVARKSYIHARDLADAIQAIAERAEPGRIYNAGPPEPVAIRRLVELVAAEFEIPFEEFVEERPGRPGEDAQYWLDSSLIKRELDWEPRISLEEGVAEMADWARTYADQLREASTDYVLRA